MSRLFRIGLLALALVAERTALATAQTRHHIIQGRVTTDSGAVIAAADVIVTIAPTAETITSKTDSSGNYRVAITNTTGEYLLYVGALGRKPFRQRVTISAVDSTAIINIKLASARHADSPACRCRRARFGPPRRSGATGNRALTPPTKRMTACSPR